MLENIIYKCPTCYNQLKRKDNRNYAVVFIIAGILLFPILMFIADGVVYPFLFFVIYIIIALCFFLKKERFEYFCKSCCTMYSESELKRKGQ